MTGTLKPNKKRLVQAWRERGGVRIIYYWLDKKERFYLLTLYAKNEVTDLTANEKRALKQFVENWGHEQT